MSNYQVPVSHRDPTIAWARNKLIPIIAAGASTRVIYKRTVTLPSPVPDEPSWGRWICIGAPADQIVLQFDLVASRHTNAVSVSSLSGLLGYKHIDTNRPRSRTDQIRAYQFSQTFDETPGVFNALYVWFFCRFHEPGDNRYGFVEERDGNVVFGRINQ